MLVRGCKIRVGDGIRVGGKIMLVSSTRPEFEEVGVFVRPIGRSVAHDVLVFVGREELVQVIRDRKAKK